MPDRRCLFEVPSAPHHRAERAHAEDNNDEGAAFDSRFNPRPAAGSELWATTATVLGLGIPLMPRRLHLNRMLAEPRYSNGSATQKANHFKLKQAQAEASPRHVRLAKCSSLCCSTSIPTRTNGKQRSFMYVSTTRIAFCLPRHHHNKRKGAVCYDFDFCLSTSTRFDNKHIRRCLASRRSVSGWGLAAHGARALQPNNFRFRLILRKVPGLSGPLTPAARGRWAVRTTCIDLVYYLSALQSNCHGVPIPDHVRAR